MEKTTKIDIRLDADVVAACDRIAELAGTDRATVMAVALATWAHRYTLPAKPARDDLTVIEAAKFLRVKVATLSTWRMREQGPPYQRIGGRLVYPRAKLEKWLAENEVKPSVTTNAKRSAAKKKSLRAAQKTTTATKTKKAAR